MRMPHQSGTVRRTGSFVAPAEQLIPAARNIGGLLPGGAGYANGFFCEAGCYALAAACFLACEGASAGWGSVFCVSACDIALAKCYRSCDYSGLS